MNETMKIAVLGLLLAFAAPVPMTESWAGLDQEAVLEHLKSPRGGARIQSRRSALRGVDASPALVAFRLDTALPVPIEGKVVPRILSRPPPA